VSGFSTDSVTVRGEVFQIRELDGKTMREAKRILDTDRHRLEFFVASKGLTEPALSEEELSKRPYIFADKISDAVFKLSKQDEQKNA
jgi:hypothetical protein